MHGCHKFTQSQQQDAQAWLGSAGLEFGENQKRKQTPLDTYEFRPGEKTCIMKKS